MKAVSRGRTELLERSMDQGEVKRLLIRPQQIMTQEDT